MLLNTLLLVLVVALGMAVIAQQVKMTRLEEKASYAHARANGRFAGLAAALDSLAVEIGRHRKVGHVQMAPWVKQLWNLSTEAQAGIVIDDEAGEC